VYELSRLLEGADTGLRRAAEQAVTKVAEMDDSRSVSEAAQSVLEKHGAGGVLDGPTLSDQVRKAPPSRTAKHSPEPTTRAEQQSGEEPAVGVGQPFEDYDSLSVAELKKRLADLTSENSFTLGELERVRAYEKDHANRVSAIRAIDLRIRRLRQDAWTVERIDRTPNSVTMSITLTHEEHLVMVRTGVFGALVTIDGKEVPSKRTNTFKLGDGPDDVSIEIFASTADILGKKLERVYLTLGDKRVGVG
jgi:hypothetical protein